MHFKPFNGFVVLNYWIKWLFLKFLPISAQVVLSVRVEKQEKVLNIRDNFLEFEVVSGWVELEGLLFEFPDTVGCFFECLGNFIVDILFLELVICMYVFLKVVIFDHPEVFKVHEECSEDGDELFEFLWVYFGDGDDFLSGESLLCAD
jgi:hypothetical protein